MDEQGGCAGSALTLADLLEGKSAAEAARVALAEGPTSQRLGACFEVLAATPARLCQVAREVVAPGGVIPDCLALRVGACGKVWRDEVVAFKCMTCAADQTCIICIDCFRGGNHEGHAYRLVRTAEGMCDCGDASSWKPSGFCSKHKGMRDGDDPTEGADPEALALSRAGIGAVCRQVRETLGPLAEKGHLGAPSLRWVAKALEALTKFAEAGDGMRRVVTECILEGEPSLLDASLQCYFRHRKGGLLDPLQMLVYATVPDFVMKHGLARWWRDNYHKISQDSEVASTAVQFLTVPTVVERICCPPAGEKSFYEVLSDACIARLTERAKEIDKYQGEVFSVLGLSTATRLEYSLDHGSERSDIYDLRYCWTSFPQAMQQYCARATCMDALLLSLLLVQQSNAVFRRDEDSRIWILFRHDELILCGNLMRLAEAAAGPDARELTQTVLQQVRRFLACHVNHSIVQRTKPSPLAPWLQSFNPYGNPHDGIYFQLPLHRFFALVLRQALLTQGHPSVADIITPGETTIFGGVPGGAAFHHLVEAPLALLVAVAQEQAGLWRRNHYGISDQVLNYTGSIRQSYPLNVDLLFLQIACSYLGPSKLAAQIVLRFSGHQPLIPTTGTVEGRSFVGERQCELLDQFFKLVLAVALDRTWVHNSAAQNRRRQIVQLLATGPLKHSEISKLLPRLSPDDDTDDEDGDDEEVPGLAEAAIRDVADKVEQAGGCLRFQLKKSSWSEVDPHYITWDAGCLAKADMCFRESGGSGLMPPHVSSLPYPALRPIELLLSSELVLGLAFSAVSEFVVSAGASPWATSGAVRRALDVLLLAIRLGQRAEEAWPLVAEQEAHFAKDNRGDDSTGKALDKLYPLRLPATGGSAAAAAKLLLEQPTGLPCCPAASLLQFTALDAAEELRRAAAAVLDEAAKASPEVAEQLSRMRSELTAGQEKGSADTAMKDVERRKKGREKQQQMLAQLQRDSAGLNFDLSDESDEEDGEEGSTDAAHTLHKQLDSTWLSDQQCAICHSPVSPGGTSDICMVALLARGNALRRAADSRGAQRTETALQKHFCVFPEEREAAVELLEKSERRQDVKRCRQLDTSDASEMVDRAEQSYRTALGDGCPPGPYIGEAVSVEHENTVAPSVEWHGESNVFMHCCGHVVHVHCIHDHRAYLCKAAASGIGNFKGSDFITPFNGEYLCPLCGRLANSVLPVIRRGPRASSIRLQADPSPAPAAVSASPVLLSFDGEQLHSALARGSDVVAAVAALEAEFQSEPQSASAAGDESETGSRAVSRTVSRATAASGDEASFAIGGDGDTEDSDPQAPQQLREAVVHFVEATTQRTHYSSDMMKKEELLSGVACFWAQQLAAVELRSRGGESVVSLGEVAWLRGVLKAVVVYLHDNHPSVAHFKQLVHLLLGVGESPPTEAEARPLLNDPLGAWALALMPTLSSPLGVPLYGALLTGTVRLCLVQVLAALLRNGVEVSVPAEGAALAQLLERLGEMAGRKPQFLADSPKLDEVVGAHLLPLLRRLAVGHCAVTAQTSPIGPADSRDLVLPPLPSEAPSQSCDQLLRWLLRETSLQTLAESLLNSEVLAHYAAGCDVLCADGEPGELPRRQLRLLPPRPHTLIPLPRSYTDLLSVLHGRCSNGCGRPTAPFPTLCLYCGFLICAGGKCCTPGQDGPVMRHTANCGGGSGLYLLLRDTRVLCVVGDRAYMVRSPYLDSHGEEDHGLHRGRPLHLNDQRWSHLCTLAQSGGYEFDTRIISQVTKVGVF
eukprot:Hpha_TRINITY_DN16451_c2_g3::TRINITY_DN16451_c2_g3_i2::g.163152::m.163152